MLPFLRLKFAYFSYLTYNSESIKYLRLTLRTLS